MLIPWTNGPINNWWKPRKAATFPRSKCWSGAITPLSSPQRLRIVRNRATAEDLAQEAMFRAWRKIGDFRGDAQFRSWVYRIATNLALNQVQRSRESTSEFPIEPAPARSAESVAIGSEIGEAWAEAINTLPPELREPYRLREANELSYQEIADQLGIPLNTVRTRIHRARGLMMERMQAWK